MSKKQKVKSTTQNTDVPEREKRSFPRPDFKAIRGRISALSEKYAYLGCAFIIPLLIFWIVYIFFEVYPFGGGSVLVLDLNGQYVFFFEALRNALHGDTSLIYSWSRSLGGEFIGIYAYYLASPLSYLVALFPQDHITEALLFIILLKTGLSGATMAFYLKKTRPETKELSAIIFSTMYALSAYAVAYAHNTMWIDAMLLLPLMIYGLEQLIDRQKFVLFTVTLTLTLISTFYIGYMMCFFVLVYFFYYYFTHATDRQNNYYGEKLHFLKALIRVAIAALVAIMIACMIIIPTVYSLQFGKTSFSKTEWKFTALFNLLDLFTKALPGSYDTVRPEGLPFIYCGVLAIIMLPMFFITKKIPIKHKIGGAAILGIMLFCMNSFMIDTFLHGMQRPNWLNCRYSFAFIFLVLVFACRAFTALDKEMLPYLCVVGGSIIALVVVIQKLGYEYLDTFLAIWITILCVVVYLVSVRFVVVKNFSNISLTVLAALVCLELFGGALMNSDSLDEDVGMSSRDGYIEYFERIRPIVEKVQESDKSFYRMEKTYTRSVCDDLALNIKGLSCSTSTLNESVIDFLNMMGYSSASHWSRYTSGNYVSDSLLGIKYLITEKSKESELLDPYMQDDEHALYAFINNYALSMAYSTGKQIRDFDITEEISPFETLNKMVSALVGSDEIIPLFKPIEHTLNLDNAIIDYSGPVYEKKMVDGKEETITIDYYFYKPKNTAKPGAMTFTFHLPEELDGSDVCMFMCSNYPREVSWELYGDGQFETVKGEFFGSDSDCIQSFGVLSQGEYRMKVTMNEKDNIMYIIKNSPVFYYLDHDLFKSVFEELKKGNMKIDDDYSSTHLKGSVNVPDGDSVMFTSIPYDEGWNVYVDGKKVPIFKTCDCLLAFDITEGEHTIEFKYFSQAMLYGITISVFGIILFFGLVLIDKRLLEKRREGKHELWLSHLEELEAERLKKEAEAEKQTASTGDTPEDGGKKE